MQSIARTRKSKSTKTPRAAKRPAAAKKPPAARKPPPAVEATLCQGPAAQESPTLKRVVEGKDVRALVTQLGAQLAVISSVQAALAAQLDIQGIYDAVGDKIREIFHNADVWIRIYDPRTNLVQCPYICERGERLAVKPYQLPELGFSTHVVRTRETLIINENMAQAFAKYASYVVPGTQMEKSSVWVPLIVGEQVRGFLNLFDMEREHAFSDSDVRLLQTLANAMSVALENARLFDETQRRSRETAALAEVGRDISSTLDLSAVMDRIARHALELLHADNSAIFVPYGDRPTYRAIVAIGDVAEQIKATEIRAGVGIIGSILEVGRAEFVNDTDADPRTIQIPGTPRRENERLMVAPLRAGATVKGAMAVWRRGGRVFDEAELGFLTGLSLHATIAIDNARLFNEAKEALARETATADILRAISSSPTDVQPVFDTIVATAKRLMNGYSSLVTVRRDDALHLAALSATTKAGDDALRRRFPVPLDSSSSRIHVRAVRSGLPVMRIDTEADADVSPQEREMARTRGYRSALAVPITRAGDAIGTISVTRTDPGSFSAREIELLQTFAAQAVIAIENVRLFTELDARNRELTEALEQQTATSEILRVISRSPTDVQPVFDTIAAAALKLCRASSANVFTIDGTLIQLGAVVCANPAAARAVRTGYPCPINRDTAASRAVLARTFVVIPDVLDDPEFGPRTIALAAGFRSVLAVPLLREGTPIGAIAVGRPQPGAFPETQIALLRTFADQAVIAIENVRLFSELQTRTGQLTRSVGELKALGEVGQAVSSTLDLETVLSTIVSRAVQLAGMDGGSIWEYDEAREQFHVRATDRLSDELVEAQQATPIRKGEGALGRLALTAEPVEIRDIADESSYQSRLRETLIRRGYRSVLAVPLLREDHLLGALAVSRTTPGEFAPEVIALLKTFATQSALAIQNARLYREIEVKSKELEAASRHKSEFLANMSHELRTPLNAIIGFSEVLSERMFGEINEKQAEYISDILHSGQHLLSLINDILDLSKIEAGRMELELSDFDLPSMIDNTLILVRERAQRRGITLARTIDGRLGIIRADERKLKQVLLNLLSNALKFTPEGGKISVSAALHDGSAEISVTDTGVGIAPEDQETVFEEFRQVGTAYKKVEGTGLGLTISRKFIELHGGRIWVTSQVGQGSTFAFMLPLR